MKRTVMLIAALLMIFAAPMSVCADGQADREQFDELVSEINRELEGVGGKKADKYLKDNDITAGKPENIAALEPEGVFESILTVFKEELTAPIKLLGKLMAAAAVCVIIKSLSPSDRLERSFGTVSALCCILIMSDALSASLDGITASVESINDFMISYIPVFTGISTASGNAVSAAGYYSVMFFVCELMSYIALKLLSPLMSCVLAMSLVSSLDPALGLGQAAESIKSFVTKSLAFIMIVFTALMSITGLSGSAADSLGAKAVKFAASSFIPVIGSSVSEAYSAVKGGLGAIRTSVGLIGVITVFIIVLRPLLSVIALRLVVSLAKTVHEMFSLGTSSGILSGISSVLSIAMSVLVAYSLFFIVATSVILMTAAGF